jgi:hypothetical protein
MPNMVVLGVVGHEQGTDKAAHLADVFDGRLTDEEKKAKIFHCVAHTTRDAGRYGVRKQRQSGSRR